ncbi:alpha-L-fucosidase [Solitalea lacus]|uniref:alpha-L-fucosidase n=1 Tax=Solitalea lacus TaxID=2911172 RepID=UPI001EDAFA61|nr:alpha-L-fucosidase [Solitalea lacus]UKJ05822.1 alpha-L-fucosidase [Solitalea lacus]
MKKSVLFILLLLSFSTLKAQTDYHPTPENIKARQWFEQARFGMFIHWGASSVLGDGEWVMNNRNIKVEDYKRLIKFFNPVDFNAAKWVSTAKSAGMKYITIITRHHDSFSNWDTQQSDWKITNTPYGKDVLKQLADECHKQGVKLCFYYSILDWFRDDYQYETGRTGKGTGRTKKEDWNNYINFMKAQLTELLTNYGEVTTIWFDGHWDQLDNDKDKAQKSKVDWHYDEIYSLIHKLQPQCLVGNNHHLSPLPGEDFQMFERDLPGENKAGLSGQSVSRLPLETCETLNGSWGFNITDKKYKSTKEIVHLLVRAAGYGSNLLLNIGPMPNGEIQPEFIDRLQQTGNWLNTYGETVYNTSGGFVKPQEWGAVTQNGSKTYIHLLNPKEDHIALTLPDKVKKVYWFDNKQPIKYKKEKSGSITFDITQRNQESIDNIIVMEMAK